MCLQQGAEERRKAQALCELCGCNTLSERSVLATSEPPCTSISALKKDASTSNWKELGCFDSDHPPAFPQSQR